MTRLSSVWPTISSRFSTRHTLTRLAGMKPRRPATSHSSPPLLAAVTFAATTMPAWTCDQSSTATAWWARATS
ncbi:MAG: hypothetical protein ACKON7_04405 [Planctomycetaceae bacterium]